MGGVLEGVKVVELAGWIAVPSAAAILSDWGADVIKVEPTVGGDPLRGLANVQGVDMHLGDSNVGFELYNRNKRGVTMDLSQPNAVNVLKSLVKNADVLMTSYQPRLQEKLGVTYEDLKECNPRLIYVTSTGFGHEGPDRDKPGYDYSAYYARAGFLNKFAEGMPYPPFQRPGMGDNTTSLAIVAAISGALFSRERTGQGQEVRLSLYHTGVWVLSCDVQSRMTLGVEIGSVPRYLTPNPLWNSYWTKNARWIQLVMIQAQRHWPAFCRTLGLNELEHDPRFATVEARAQNCAGLVEIIDGEMAKRTAAEWKEILTEGGLVFQEAFSISDVVEDQQAWENDFFAKIPHPVAGEFTTVASPMKFSETPSTVRSAAPALGQHTEEVFLEAGWDWDDIVWLKSKGIIG